MKEPAKIEWIEKARKTFRYHRSKLLSNEKWTATLTAKSLNRSTGSISQDLLVARWLRTHENQLSRCDNLKEALEFIKKAKKNMDLEAEV